MAKTYNGNITKHTDWGGDASTSGLPVSGKVVQKFIKDELNSKIGSFYKPEGSTIVYSFIETGDESLILDSFETVSKYSVIINQDGLELSHSVLAGSTGNTVDFGFKIVDDNNMTSDSSAKIEISINSSGINNKFTTEVAVAAGECIGV